MEEQVSLYLDDITTLLEIPRQAKTPANSDKIHLSK
jgi:hypothetical protein